MRGKASWRTFSIFGLFIILLFCCWLFIMPYSVEAFFDVGRGHSIVMVANRYFEMNRDVRFQIRKNLVWVVYEGCVVEYDLPGDSHGYKAVSTHDGSTVGVVDNFPDPQIILMYDFERSSAWPCNKYSSQQRDELFSRLQDEHPNLQRPDYWNK